MKEQQEIKVYSIDTYIVEKIRVRTTILFITYTFLCNFTHTDDGLIRIG